MVDEGRESEVRITMGEPEIEPTEEHIFAEQHVGQALLMGTFKGTAVKAVSRSMGDMGIAVWPKAGDVLVVKQRKLVWTVRALKISQIIYFC